MDEEWSVVTRKGKPAKSKKKIDVAELAELLTDDQKKAMHRHRLDKSKTLFHEYSPQEPDQTYDQAQRQLSKILHEWDNDSINSVIPSNIGPVDHAICLGLGSLSSIGRDSRLQLAAFLSIARHEAVCAGQLYAQDPVFNAIDKQLLAQHGIQVVEDPTAFQLITRNSFVFAPHFPVTSWPAGMRTGVPSLVIGNDVKSSLDSLPGPDRVVLRFRQWTDLPVDEIPDLDWRRDLERFISTHGHVECPIPDGCAHAFASLSVYWHREEEEVES